MILTLSLFLHALSECHALQNQSNIWNTTTSLQSLVHSKISLLKTEWSRQVYLTSSYNKNINRAENGYWQEQKAELYKSACSASTIKGCCYDIYLTCLLAPVSGTKLRARYIFFSLIVSSLVLSPAGFGFDHFNDPHHCIRHLQSNASCLMAETQYMQKFVVPADPV